MLQVLSPAGGAVGSCWTQEEVGRGKEAGHWAISWKAYLFLDPPSLSDWFFLTFPIYWPPSRYPARLWPKQDNLRSPD